MLKNQISIWMPIVKDGLGKAKLLAKKEGLKLLVIFLVLAWAMKKDLKVEISFFSPKETKNVSESPTSSVNLTRQVKRKDLRYRDYIKEFAPMAIKEMKANKIPASIILAQGLLESDGGASKLASENNNHFGIKCFSKKCKKGHCANFSDDSHKDFFRIYSSAHESYLAHSVFLKKERYRHLANLPPTDYISWAYGLKKAGYATDKKYAEKLIGLINRYDLSKYDKMA